MLYPLYSPEQCPTPTNGPYLTNMGVPREGVMVCFAQIHLLMVVGHPLAMGVLGTAEPAARRVEGNCFKRGPKYFSATLNSASKRSAFLALASSPLPSVRLSSLRSRDHKIRNGPVLRW